MRLRASREVLEYEKFGMEKSQTLRIGAMGYNSDPLYCASRRAIQVQERTLLLVARLYFVCDNAGSVLPGTIANI